MFQVEYNLKNYFISNLPGVPDLLFSSNSSIGSANPKSISLQNSLSTDVNIIFSNFKSLWTILFLKQLKLSNLLM